MGSGKGGGGGGATAEVVFGAALGFFLGDDASLQSLLLDGPGEVGEDLGREAGEELVGLGGAASGVDCGDEVEDGVGEVELYD